MPIPKLEQTPQGLLPFYILPPIHWYILAIKEGGFRVNGDELFAKQSLRSRYLIAGPNSIQTLSIPIQHEHRGLSLHQAHIDYTQSWVKNHKQAWQTAYGKSPFFEYYDYKFWKIFDSFPATIGELSKEIITLLHANLGLHSLPVEWVHTPQNIQDFQSNWGFQKAYEQTIRSLTIPSYSQVFEQKHGFRSGVSIIDLLFNKGPMAIEYFAHFNQQPNMRKRNRDS